MKSPKTSKNSPAANDKLDVVIRLLAAIYTKGMKNSDAITSLGRFHFTPAEIADMIGVSGHNVSQVLYASRKGSTKKQRRKQEGTSEVSVDG